MNSFALSICNHESVNVSFFFFRGLGGKGVQRGQRCRGERAMFVPIPQSVCRLLPFSKWQLQNAVAYRSLSITRSCNCKALSGKVWVFWIGGRLWEVVAYERWLHMEVRPITVYWPAGFSRGFLAHSVLYYFFFFFEKSNNHNYTFLFFLCFFVSFFLSLARAALDKRFISFLK